MISERKRLHIGTGKNYLPGWTNLDIFSSVRADVYADMTSLPFDRESFDEIYCCHTLEHCHRHMVLATLTHWRDLLRACGVLKVSVPDFAACVEWYMKGGGLPSITGLLWGGQNHPKNNHFIGFDGETMTAALHMVGFKEIQRYDWRTTDHAQHDDFASAFLPHMDKEYGQLMSLNMRAVK